MPLAHPSPENTDKKELNKIFMREKGECPAMCLERRVVGLVYKPVGWISRHGKSYEDEGQIKIRPNRQPEHHLHSIIIEYMAKKTDKKITSSSTLHETKEKSKIKSILKKLIHIKKGH